jgi:WD40 repeat protein
MKKQFKKGVQLFSAVVFTACTFGSLELKAQAGGSMWTLDRTLNVGSKVNAVEFISVTKAPSLAVGNDGGVELRDVATGNIYRTFGTNGRVNSISCSKIFPFMVVGSFYSASVFNIYSKKKMYLSTSGAQINEVLFIDGSGSQSTIITGDVDGNISFFNFDSTASSLTPYNTVHYKANAKNKSTNPSVGSMIYWNGMLSAGFNNQLEAWDFKTGVEKLNIYEAPGPNQYGRLPILADVAAGSKSFLLSADRDSIQGYTYEGNQLFRVPFMKGDSPVDMCFAEFNFPYVAIATMWDRCLVYKLDDNNATLIGNFSNHQYTVSSVDIWSFGTGKIYMATGSGDQTVEIWKYNEQYTR